MEEVLMLHHRDFSVAVLRLTRNDILMEKDSSIPVIARNEVVWQSPREKHGGCFAPLAMTYHWLLAIASPEFSLRSPRFCRVRSARSDEKSLKRSGSQIKNLEKGSIRFITGEVILL